jgi:hypothetical protein
MKEQISTVLTNTKYNPVKTVHGKSKYRLLTNTKSTLLKPFTERVDIDSMRVVFCVC